MTGTDSDTLVNQIVSSTSSVLGVSEDEVTVSSSEECQTENPDEVGYTVNVSPETDVDSVVDAITDTDEFIETINNQLSRDGDGDTNVVSVDDTTTYSNFICSVFSVFNTPTIFFKFLQHIFQRRIQQSVKPH